MLEEFAGSQHLLEDNTPLTQGQVMLEADSPGRGEFDLNKETTSAETDEEDNDANSDAASPQRSDSPRQLALADSSDEEEDGEQVVMHIIASELPRTKISMELRAQETAAVSDLADDATYHEPENEDNEYEYLVTLADDSKDEEPT